MVGEYIWDYLNKHINALYTTFGFHKTIGLRAKKPSVVFLTFYEDMTLDDLQNLLMELDDKAVAPFIHIIVSDDFDQDDYEVLMIHRDMTPINYSYEASSRMGLILVDASDDPDMAANCVLEMFSLTDFPIINTLDIDMSESGFDLSYAKIAATEN